MNIPFPPKRILVPVDLSKPSMAALRSAKDLARLASSRLEIVYVENPTAPAMPYDLELEALAARAMRAAERRFKADWLRRLTEETKDFPNKDLTLKWIKGWPPSQLRRLASRRTADLVVTGTHGHRGARRLLLGSMAETLIRKARVPVLAVHEGTRIAIGGGILVPYNMRDYADEALSYALELAALLKDSLAVLYVASIGEWEIDLKSALSRRIEEKFGTEAARKVRLVIRRGDPRREIAAEANRGRYRLVVLSAHVKSLSSDAFLGSTAERVLRHTKSPVLAVPHLAYRRRTALKRALRSAPIL